MAIRNKRKKILYILLGLTILAGLGIFGGIQYVKSSFFADRPNTLTIVGELHPIPFEWIEEQFGEYIEPHSGILIPVSVPGIEKKLYMQFDTGAPSTFIRSGAMKSLADRGVEFELFEEDEQTRVKKFELNIGGNQVILNSGRVRKRDIEINWDDPEAINIIGSIGADIIDQKVCEIDFASREMRLHDHRTDKLKSLGKYVPFEFKGRRIMLSAQIKGIDMQLLYDSGCSSFGLITSKYHFDRYTDENAKDIHFNANRFGDPVPIHHRESDLTVRFGDIELPLKRISYVEKYTGLQSAFGGLVNGGFFGNKSLTECTLVLDVIANEFLVVPPSDLESATSIASPTEIADQQVE